MHQSFMTFTLPEAVFCTCTFDKKAKKKKRLQSIGYETRPQRRFASLFDFWYLASEYPFLRILLLASVCERVGFCIYYYDHPPSPSWD